MKAIVLADRDGPTIQVTDVPVPTCGEFGVLVAPEAASINHLDYEVILGRGVGAAAGLPHILGCDPVGQVIEVGRRVESFEVGDRVAARPWVSCGDCPYCASGEDNQCGNGQIFGVHRSGGMAEFVAVPQRGAFRIPNSLPAATMAAQANSTPVAIQILSTAKTTSADTLLVLGAAGALGSALVQVGKFLGATVIAGASDSEQLPYLDELGADHSFSYGDEPDFAEGLRPIVGAGGVTVYTELSGSSDLWNQATSLIGRHGRVVVVGKHAGAAVDLNLLWIYSRRITIIGSGGASRASFEQAVELADSGVIKPPHHVVLKPDQFMSGLETFEARDQKKKVVIDLTLLAGS